MTMIPKFNLQFFAEGDDGGDVTVDTMADLDSLLDEKFGDGDGGQDADGDDKPDTDDGDDDSGDESGDEPDNDADDSGDDQDGEDSDEQQDDQSKGKGKKQTKTASKDNHAFAAMRKQNTDLNNKVGQLQETMKQLAMGLGIKTEDNDDMMQQLTDAAYRGRSKREGKTPQQIADDNATMKELQAYRVKEIKDHAYRELGELRDKFGVDDDELRGFMQTLLNEGVNPFAQKTPLKASYIERNFESIVQKRVDAAVEEALKRDNAAEQHSGKSKKSGKKQTGKTEVNSMAELDNWLNNNLS